jgi:hypothetical protein
LSELFDSVFEDIEFLVCPGHARGGGQVSAAPRQESQEEILEDALALLTDEDIPPADDELVGVLRAWARQEAWAQARKLAAVAELARRRQSAAPRPPGPASSRRA